MKNIRTKILIILLLFTGVFAGACMQNDGEPVGPSIDNEAEFPLDYEIVEENWISDFNAYQGGYSTNIYVDNSLIIEVPIVYENHPYAWPFGVGNKTTFTWYYELNGASSNCFLGYYYESYTHAGDEFLWGLTRLRWVNGPINLNDYGNALAFKARGDGEIYVTLCFNWRVSKIVVLGPEWHEYILPFKDFSNMDRLSSEIENTDFIYFGPPRMAGLKGRVAFDDVRLVYYRKKR